MWFPPTDLTQRPTNQLMVRLSPEDLASFDSWWAAVVAQCSNNAVEEAVLSSGLAQVGLALYGISLQNAPEA